MNSRQFLQVGSQMIQSLLKKAEAFRGRKLVVIGDSGLDEYVFGKVRRISPEAPVPVVEVTDDGNEDFRLGLSTNVAQNIASLGGEALLVSVVGRDAAADRLRKILTAAKVAPDYLVVDDSRPTTRKMRIMAGQHHIVRVDYEHQRFLSPEIHKRIVNMVGDLLKQADGVLIQDYAKGVISEELVGEVVALAKAKGKPVFGDPHRSSPLKTYKGVDLMTPNNDEAVALSGISVSDLRRASDSMKEIGDVIRKTTGTQTLVITRGKEGMTLFNGEKITHIPTFARSVFDVTGAGDTVIAAISLSHVSGLTLEESCLIGNYAAGVVVGKIGCVPCSFNELSSFMKTQV